LILNLANNRLAGRIPSELINLTSLVDNLSDFRGNSMYSENLALSDFLNLKQVGCDWESYQTPVSSKIFPGISILLLE